MRWLKRSSDAVRKGRAAPEARASTALEWAKVLAGPVATLIVSGLVTWVGTAWLNAREAREAKERLYAQLLTQREQNDTVVRKDMFQVVINRFLSSGAHSDWANKVLQLELLANNFSQSLDLALSPCPHLAPTAPCG